MIPPKVGGWQPVTPEVLGLPPGELVREPDGSLAYVRKPRPRRDGVLLLLAAVREWPRLVWSQRGLVSVTHASPRGVFSLSSRTRCCGERWLTLPHTDRLTHKRSHVTCGLSGGALRRARRRGAALRVRQQVRGFASTPRGRVAAVVLVAALAFGAGMVSAGWAWLS